MNVLEFIFRDFWHWLGTLILLIAICPWNKVKIRNELRVGNGETSRKCRASKATVLSITCLDGSPFEGTEIPSDRSENFVYRIGETVEIPNFDEDRWVECAPGIHHFITREEAVRYT